MNPMHLIAVLSMLVGWHLDAIDARLIEENQAAIRSLNIPTELPVIIDNDDRGRPVIRRPA